MFIAPCKLGVACQGGFVAIFINTLRYGGAIYMVIVIGPIGTFPSHIGFMRQLTIGVGFIRLFGGYSRLFVLFGFGRVPLGYLFIVPLIGLSSFDSRRRRFLTQVDMRVYCRYSRTYGLLIVLSKRLLCR